MVKVRQHHPQEEAEQIDIQAWVESLIQGYTFESIDVEASATEDITHACVFASDALKQDFDPDKLWSNAVGCFQTALEMAEILADLSLDSVGLQAAILYRAVREGRISIEKVRSEFGAEVAGLIDKVLRMAVVSTLNNSHGRSVFGHGGGQQASKIREMLVSIIDDIRVPLIKIAERTCAIRAVKNDSREKRVRVAREVFDIYAPLAHRLGLGNIKWELEDLSFRYLQPDDYSLYRQPACRKTPRSTGLYQTGGAAG